MIVSFQNHVALMCQGLTFFHMHFNNLPVLIYNMSVLNSIVIRKGALAQVALVQSLGQEGRFLAYINLIT